MKKRIKSPKAWDIRTNKRFAIVPQTIPCANGEKYKVWLDYYYEIEIYRPRSVMDRYLGALWYELQWGVDYYAVEDNYEECMDTIKNTITREIAKDSTPPRVSKHI